MTDQTTTVQLQDQGRQILIHGVPVRMSETGEELGFTVQVTRQLEVLVREARQQAGDARAVELTYRAPEVPPPDPVSVELRRALRQRGMSGTEVARQLGVTPPVVSRWLSPDYHAHGLESLRRIAEVLGMDVEVRLVPKRSA